MRTNKRNTLEVAKALPRRFSRLANSNKMIVLGRQNINTVIETASNVPISLPEADKNVSSFADVIDILK